MNTAAIWGVALGAGLAWGGEAPDAADKAKAQALEDLATVKEFSGILKDEDDAKKIEAWLKGHEAALKRLGFEDLAKWKAEVLDEVAKGLRKLAKPLVESVKTRETLLNSKTGKSFAERMAGSGGRAGQRGVVGPGGMLQARRWGGGPWQAFMQMDRETFQEVQQDLLKDWQWSLELDRDAKELYFDDQLGQTHATATFAGKLTETGQGRAQAVGVRVFGKLQVMEEVDVKARIGLSVRELDDDDRLALKALKDMKDVSGGVVVKKVAPDSLAAEAGLKRGDIVTKVDGQVVKDKKAFEEKLEELAPGDSVELTYWRDGKSSKAELEVPAAQVRGAERFLR